MTATRLQVASANSLPPTRRFLSQISLNLAPDDRMYLNNDAHYLNVGASALNVIMATLQLADVPDPATILDFGSGAGRVMRWLRAAFPMAALSACDIRAEDMSFCRQEFSAETWVSGTDIDALSAPGKFDLIWAGSVLTHLSADDSIKLINKLLSWTQPGGILAISLHGRFAKWRQDVGEYRYIHDEAWRDINTQLARKGFGYADYTDQSSYGISLTRLTWSAGLIEKLPGARLLALSEKVWDGHHDVLVIQNRIIIETHTGSSSVMANADYAALQQTILKLRREIADLRQSTSWRVTAPLRSIVNRLRGRS